MAKTKHNGRRNGEAAHAMTPQAAYFLSLSLENVRCFGPKQTLDLSDGNGKPARWTIILGLNGTGKTTILQALAGFELLEISRGIDGSSDKDSRLLYSPYSKPLTYPRGYETERKALMIAKTGLSCKLTDVPTRTNISTIDLVKESETGFRSSCTGINELNRFWCCAYGASRRMGYFTQNNYRYDDPTASLYTDEVHLRNVEDWLIQLDYSTKASTEGAQQQRLDQVKKMLIEIMPDREVEGIRLVAGTGPNPQARTEFKTPYGWVPLRHLGYGYQTLIAWMVDFASRLVERYPDSPNPLAEPAVVLVDEIDLHLHPTWQRKLMDVLTERFPNTQFIATAHSPLVVQAAADANLAVLRREGDHVIIDNDVDNIRNWRIDQILTSDLFGLETARPPQIEILLLERKKLLTKAKLTESDKRKIKEIEEEIGELPGGETAQEVKEREEMRKTLELLKERRLAQ